jgi:hypothetical protein
MFVAVEALPVSAPIKVVVVSAPVLGTKLSFVLDTLAGRLPVFAVTHTGYTAVAVATSFVTPTFVAFVAVGTVPVTAIVTAPVAPDTEILDPAIALVTPVFVTVTLPVALTLELKPVFVVRLNTPELEIIPDAMLMPVPAEYVPDPANCEKMIELVPTII